MERVLGIDLGVRVFAPRYQIRYEVSCGTYNQPQKIILIDLKHVINAKNAEKFCGHENFDVVVVTYSKVLCLWITSPVMQCLLVEFYVDPFQARPILEFSLIPDTRPKFVLSCLFNPFYRQFKL